MSAVPNSVFLEAMFADALPGTFTVITAFRADPHKASRSDWYGRQWAPGGDVPRWFDGANSYLTVSAFEPDENGELRRRKNNFSSMHAVMVDDVGTKVAMEQLKLPPSALIETSPGNFQAFYFLVQTNQTRDRLLCERLIDRMITAGLTKDGTDPGMKGVTRYGRLPVGINNKSAYVEKLGHPFEVHCTVFTSSRRYGVPEIAAAWKLDIPPKFERPRAPVVPIVAAKNRRTFAALLNVFELAGMYHGRIGNGPWHAITCPWIAEHTGRAVSGSALSDPSEDNNFAGGFRCHHGHCGHRTIHDIWYWIGAFARGEEDLPTEEQSV